VAGQQRDRKGRDGGEAQPESVRRPWRGRVPRGAHIEACADIPERSMIDEVFRYRHHRLGVVYLEPSPEHRHIDDEHTDEEPSGNLPI
jgi:hypothetical protein